MIAAVVVAAVVFVWWRARASKLRRSTLKANQAAQQVFSPYASLAPRSPRDGLLGALASRFLRGKGF